MQTNLQQYRKENGKVLSEAGAYQAKSSSSLKANYEQRQFADVGKGYIASAPNYDVKFEKIACESGDGICYN